MCTHIAIEIAPYTRSTYRMLSRTVNLFIHSHGWHLSCREWYINEWIIHILYMITETRSLSKWILNKSDLLGLFRGHHFLIERLIYSWYMLSLINEDWSYYVHWICDMNKYYHWLYSGISLFPIFNFITKQTGLLNITGPRSDDFKMFTGPRVLLPARSAGPALFATSDNGLV